MGAPPTQPPTPPPASEAGAAPRPRSGWTSGFLPLVAFLVAVVPLGSYALIHLPIGAHLGLSIGLMGIGLLILRRFPTLRIAAMLLSVAASGRYLFWRGTETLFIEFTADGLFSIALFGAELYGFMILLGGYFQTAIVTDRKPPALPTDPNLLPSVDIFIPTYNEPIDVLRRTVVGAMAIEYPKKRVYILDDTPKTHKNPKKAASLEARRNAVAALARETGCTSLRRPNNKGAKAGNINHALQHTDGELIAIFDADHVPVRTFLHMTVGFFIESAKIALVQTPHHFYNPDPFERNLFREGRMPPEQHLFYHRIQKGNDFWNSAFFCGSCAVLRRSALLGVGGIAQETVTEDAHTALKLHGQGWESRYVDVPQAAGLATEKFGFHVQQRIRWARGMAQILRIDNPLLRPGLTLAQRFNYFNAAGHFLFGIPRLVYLIAPSLFLIVGLHPLNADVRQVLIYAMPHLFLVFACTASVNKNTRFSFWPEVYETSIAWYTAWVTTVALIAPKIGSFNVTPKGDQVTRVEFDWRSARPMLVLYAISLVSLVLSPWRIASEPAHWDTIAVAAIWNLYNLVVLSASIMVAVERPQRRQFDRIAVDTPGVLRERSVVIQPMMETAFEAKAEGRQAVQMVASGGKALPWVAPPPPPSLPNDLQVHAQAPTARNVSVAPARNGRIVDLSEGGARMVMETALEVPEHVSVQLTSPSGAPIELEGQVVTQREEGEDEHLVVGIKFDHVTPDQRIALIETMFTDPSSWVKERFQEDAPLRAAFDVVMSPIRVLGNHLLGRNPRVDHKGEHLTAFADTAKCPSCGSEQLAVLSRCGRCFADMPKSDSTKVARRSASERLSSLTRGAGALPLIALAVVLAIGWKPIVDPLNGQLREINEERVTPTRVGELAAAHRQLSSLHRQLRWALIPFAPSLSHDWSKHLWGARYGSELDRRDDPDWYEVVVLLDEACLTLESAGRAYREGQNREEVRTLADKAAERLEHASRLLAATLREQEAL